MFNDSERGVSLIITFFIMIIVLAVVLSISILLYSEVKVIRNIGNSMVSFYAGESGIEKFFITIGKLYRLVQQEDYVQYLIQLAVLLIIAPLILLPIILWITAFIAKPQCLLRLPLVVANLMFAIIAKFLLIQHLITGFIILQPRFHLMVYPLTLKLTLGVLLVAPEDKFRY